MGRSMADRSLTRFAPGPRPVPLIGNLLDFRGDGMALGFFRYWPRLGDVIRFRFGVQEAVALVHPEHTRQVFIKNRGNYVKGISVESLTWLTGAGLFTADGELWQTQRRMMHPHFTPAATRNYEQLRDEMVTIFLAGHETTAVAMTWTLALLASHRFAEDALLAELSRALGGRDATTADPGARLHPPADRPSTPMRSAASRWSPARSSCRWSSRPTATPSSGRIRSASTRSASRPSAAASAIPAHTCPSGQVTGCASA